MFHHARIVLVFVSVLFTVSICAAQTVLLDFGTDNCHYCRVMAPVVDRLKNEGAPIQPIDASRAPEQASRFGVTGYPTFVMLVDGRETGRIVGATTYEKLRGLLATADPQRLGAGKSSRGRSIPATFASTTQPAKTDLSPFQRRLLESSVRIRVDDPQGHAFGTGTVVDARQGEALIVTCAHLFRDDQKRPLGAGAKVTVELFRASATGAEPSDRVEAMVVRTNFDKDIALIAIRSPSVQAMSPIASSTSTVAKGDAVYSVGCDEGADPTLRTSQVNALNRYLGPANITASGAPVVGRSGGGLFNARGELVGVCFAADEESDEGLYVAVGELHTELDAQGLAALYRREQPAAQLALASASTAAPLGSPQGLEPVGNEPVVRGQDRGWDSQITAVAPIDPIAPAKEAALAPAGLTPVERAALAEVAQAAVENEVVCVVRPKDSSGSSEVITLRNVSPEFVRTLRDLQAQNGGAPR